MKFLAIDTSTDALSIALAEGESADSILGVQATTTMVSPRKHGETLTWLVEQMLAGLAWAPSNIDAIVVGVGPGSYTGLRIGVTFAKTCASALNIPAYTVSSLGLMATSVPYEKTYIIPLMDARRLSAYMGVYQNCEGRLRCLQADGYWDFEKWLQAMEHGMMNYSDGAFHFVGNGIGSFVEVFQARFPELSVQWTQGIVAYPNMGQGLNCLDWIPVEDVTLLTPNYAHETLAETEWREAQSETKTSDDSSTSWIEITSN